MGNNRTLKFAILGCGKIAQRHAEHISSRGTLVAVCDVVKERADQLAKAYGAKAYYTIHDLLDHDKIDVVAVCTPNGLHAEQSIACLERGINVLCEKPMAISTKDCEAMIAAATRSGKLLAIVKQNRFNPPVVALKRLIDEGKLGKIYSIQLNCFWNRNDDYYRNSDWRGTANMDGGILFTQFSHFIDLLYWIGGDVSRATGYSSNFNHRQLVQGEDTGVVILEMCSGALASVHYTINSFSKNMEGSLTIFAEKGTVKVGGEYLNKLEYQAIESLAVPVLPAGAPANDYGGYQGSMSNHDKVYDNLLIALRDGGPITASGEDGLKTVEIISRIYAAARRDIPVMSI